MIKLSLTEIREAAAAAMLERHHRDIWADGATWAAHWFSRKLEPPKANPDEPCSHDRIEWVQDRRVWRCISTCGRDVYSGHPLYPISGQPAPDDAIIRDSDALLATLEGHRAMKGPNETVVDGRSEVGYVVGRSVLDELILRARNLDRFVRSYAERPDRD